MSLIHLVAAPSPIDEIIGTQARFQLPDIILLYPILRGTSTGYIIHSIIHETIHHALYHAVGREACEKYDNICYNVEDVDAFYTAFSLFGELEEAGP